VLGLVLSTVAYFIASFFAKRYLDDMGIPKTMTRGLVIFIFGLAAAYGVAFLVELF
jgi:fucose permease